MTLARKAVRSGKSLKNKTPFFRVVEGSRIAEIYEKKGIVRSDYLKVKQIIHVYLLKLTNSLFWQKFLQFWNLQLLEKKVFFWDYFETTFPASVM